MTIDEMLARESIRYLMALYNSCGDRGAVDEMMGCFAPDAVLEVPDAQAEGREAIRDYFLGIRDGGRLTGAEAKPARHHTSTSRIEIDSPETAHGWTYFALLREGITIQTGLYVDRFVCAQGRWMLAHRRVKLDHDALK